MRTTLAAIVGIILGSVARADPGDATLKYYLTNSTLVVAGRIETSPFGVVYMAAGYSFTFRVSDVVKGTPPKTDTIDVWLVQYGQASPLLRKNTKCVLFLKPGGDKKWWGFDPWFSIQPHNPILIGKLKNFAGTASRKPKTLPPYKPPKTKPGAQPPKATIPKVPEIESPFPEDKEKKTQAEP
jgi:hypothetical protein